MEKVKEGLVKLGLQILRFQLGKMVPVAEADPYRDEDKSVTGRSGASNGHDTEDTDFDERSNAKPSGPSDRSLHTGQIDPIVPGSGDKLNGRHRVL